MSDEITMNQQPSKAPAILTGTAIGAAAGGLTAGLTKHGRAETKYNSFEDLVKEMSEKDKFTSTLEELEGELKTDAESVAKDVQAAAEKWDNEFKEFKAKNNVELPADSKEMVALKDAQAAYDKKYSDLLNEEIRKVTDEQFRQEQAKIEEAFYSKLGIPEESRKYESLTEEQLQQLNKELSDLKIPQTEAEIKEIAKSNITDEMLKSEREAIDTAKDVVEAERAKLSDFKNEDDLKKLFEQEKGKSKDKALEEAAESSKSKLESLYKGKIKWGKVGAWAAGIAAAGALVGAMLAPKND